MKRKFIHFWERLLLSIVKSLPDPVRLSIRSNSEVIKRMDYPQYDIFLNIDSKIEWHERLHSCGKEPEMIEWIQTFLKEGDVFYDIGANVGAYSLVAAKYSKGKIKIYSFEPGFMNFAQLCKNIHINNCSDSIIPLQVALSDQTIMDTFHYNNLTPGGALHTLGKSRDAQGDIFEPIFSQSVLTYRIDDLIKQFQLPVPNHIKIDVDGTEHKILEGAVETIQNPSVKSLFLEIEDGSKEADKIGDFLKRNHFKIHFKHKHTPADDAGPFSKMYNCLFVRFRD